MKIEPGKQAAVQKQKVILVVKSDAKAGPTIHVIRS
jgi:hypothetical protein